ncbi:MAG: diphosphomevalonate decarboxylase [Deltaproteobacteria bacterium]|nr:diphosphomevalonate decarboxylase [Deltaproteobacteria bacterium]
MSTATVGRARARAGTNIALVKYWGKRDTELNLPSAGSLSLTLAELGTETQVTFVARTDAQREDIVLLGGKSVDEKFRTRVSRFLDRVRSRAQLDATALVETSNTVPTASGLASSASGFAALAVAASHAAGLRLSDHELSQLARLGSGSAARSIFGGLALMSAGQAEDGHDAVAKPIVGAEDWPLRLVIAMTSSAEKSLSSTAAMTQTEKTSPYYPAWVASVDADLEAACAAISARNFHELGRTTERSCLRMHASALAADPGILYFNSATVAAIETVRALRQDGVPVYFTIDAGPHVKALCLAQDTDRIEKKLATTPGVLRTMVAGPGPGAEWLTTTP